MEAVCLGRDQFPFLLLFPQWENGPRHFGNKDGTRAWYAGHAGTCIPGLLLLQNKNKRKNKKKPTQPNKST